MDYDQPITPRTPKGMRDFLPTQKKSRDAVLGSIRRVFESYGFEPLETPLVEMYEILSGKIGAEEKLMYRFQDRGDRELALRYDQTVPLARVIAQYPDIPKPFKRYQIQNVYRAENTQKGRYRELLQVDIDTIGSASPLADAEIIECSLEVYKRLGFQNARMLLNSRTLLFDLIKNAGVPNEETLSVIATIDKIKKIGKAGVIAELNQKGLALDIIDKLFDAFENAKPDESLREVLDLLSAAGVRSDQYKFDPYLARGLDYYTGVIFECVLDNYDSGSVGGGGRYDQLIGTFSGSQIPATGFAFGFDRILEAMEDLNLPIEGRPQVDALVTVFDSSLAPQSLRTAKKLRASLNIELYAGSEELNKQLRYADRKGIKYVIIIGPDEVESSSVTIKNLNSGEQQTLSLEKVSDFIKE